MKRVELILGTIAIILFILHFVANQFTTALAYYLIAYAMFWFFAGIPVILGKKYTSAFDELEKDQKQIIPMLIAAATGVFISVGLIGAAFKLLHWPGGDFDLYIGLAAAAILFIASAVLYFMKKNKLYLKIIIRIFIFVAFGIWALVCLG